MYCIWIGGINDKYIILWQLWHVMDNLILIFSRMWSEFKPNLIRYGDDADDQKLFLSNQRVGI